MSFPPTQTPLFNYSAWYLVVLGLALLILPCWIGLDQYSWTDLLAITGTVTAVYAIVRGETVNASF